MASNRLKPKVGIVFSQTDKFSGESLNLASYFCGLLSSSGYSEIYMIGFQSDGMPGEVYPRRIKYIPRGETSPKEVPVSLRETRDTKLHLFLTISSTPILTGIRRHLRSFPCAPGLPSNSFDSQLKRYQVVLCQTRRNVTKPPKYTRVQPSTRGAEQHHCERRVSPIPVLLPLFTCSSYQPS